MTCELCNEKPATVHFKQILNGQEREMAICEGCAKEHGFDVQSPLAMTDFLFGVGVKEAPDAAEEKSCPGCHMRNSDFQKSSRLGCPRCYETFTEQVLPMLAAMQRGPQHQGKVPVSARIQQNMAELKTALDKAIEDQDFEQAAVLRDKIQASKDGNAAVKDECAVGQID